MPRRKLLNKKDIWLFAGLAAFAALLFAWHGLTADEARYARVIVDGQTVLTVPLAHSGDRIYALDGPNVFFYISHDGAAFYSSDCPDQICVHMGLLTMPGQTAVCMPNRASLHIMGPAHPGDGVVDIIAN